MGRLRVGVSLSILLVLLPWRAVVSPATADSSAICAATWMLTISPGVTSAPQRNMMTSNGPTGTLVCEGLVDGHMVTGPGTLSEAGEFEGSCATGSGAARFVFSFPTTSGPQAITVETRFVYGPGAGTRLSDQIPGTFQFIATKGDCITSPITQVRVFSQVLLLV